ncbi:unnamed protein product [Polarella glacialis]|uniref:Uncharacterized protein n=1 Tax=Polarella glacialis TaxID=89957 RepID=A0A813HEA7_POLGL|nr:unnamed protein product [Polarella glacialis]
MWIFCWIALPDSNFELALSKLTPACLFRLLYLSPWLPAYLCQLLASPCVCFLALSLCVVLVRTSVMPEICFTNYAHFESTSSGSLRNIHFVNKQSTWKLSRVACDFSSDLVI